MSQFKFRLEKVLDLRKIDEDQAACAFAQAMEHYEHTKEQLENSVQELEDNVESRFDGDSHDGLADSIHLYLYRDSMLNKIEQLENGLELAARKVDLKRECLVEASREFKVLEKLKEKHLEDFRYKEKIAEQKIQDEQGKQVFLLQKHIAGR